MSMDTKEEFRRIIRTYYDEISIGKVSEELLGGLCDCVTDYYYKQYYRFGIQYPKSIKRYSTFQIKDLEHPATYEMIIKFLKTKLENNYSDCAKIILRMTDSELKAFEKNREDFYKMY